jgi:hypothetical protein
MCVARHGWDAGCVWASGIRAEERRRKGAWVAGSAWPGGYGRRGASPAPRRDSADGKAGGVTRRTVLELAGYARWIGGRDREARGLRGYVRRRGGGEGCYRAAEGGEGRLLNQERNRSQSEPSSLPVPAPGGGCVNSNEKWRAPPSA